MLQVSKKWPGIQTLALAALVWGAGAALFFRTSWTSGFDYISGSPGDTQLIIYLHEHLFRWLVGQVPFNSPGFFYPQPNVLGYTDAFILNLLPYSTLRFAGIDPFLSVQLLTVALSALSFLSALCIFIRYFRLQTYIALTAALLITFPNNLFLKLNIGHINFFASYYLPFIVLIALRGLEGFPRITLLSVACVATASALFALLFATNYNTAWLFAFTCLIAAMWVGIKLRDDIGPFLLLNRRPIVILTWVAGAGFLIGLIPFALVYGPVLKLFPSRSFRDYISHAPVLYDVINVSAWNALWGWLVEILLGHARATSAEQSLAVTPGMTLILLFLVWAHKTGMRLSNTRHLLVQACVAVFVVGWLATVKIGSLSAFWLPFHFIPGGGAIRAGERVQLIANMWVVAGLAVVLDHWTRRSGDGQRRRHLLTIGILLFCLIEQVNLFTAGFPRASELKQLAAVPTPPPQCQAFLINAGLKPSGQTEAMWISLQIRLPTLNGDSGWLPPGWRLTGRSPDYFDAARQWIARSNLKEQVCLYDQAGRTWSQFSPSTP